MRTNIEVVDRGIRWMAGWLIVAIALSYHSNLFVIGLVLAVTGVVGYCPLYTVFRALRGSLQHAATPQPHAH